MILFRRRKKFHVVQMAIPFLFCFRPYAAGSFLVLRPTRMALTADEFKIFFDDGRP